MAQIQIMGSSDLDIQKRKASIEKVMKLPTKALENLASLADSPRAKSYLEDPIKFKTLKTFI